MTGQGETVMSRYSEGEVKPRNGHTLVVGIVCRISGCANQKELSLEDQEDDAKESVKELYDGPTEFDVIATVGKGEALDRPELERIEKAMLSGTYDLFVFDDLSRLIRGGEAARILCVGVDHGTRSICLDDGIDTIDPTWEEDALNACSENVTHNERTSKRIKTKTANRFKKFG
jgi:site-specific DNA recombinase